MAEKILCPRCKGDVELWIPYWESEKERQASDSYNYAEWTVVNCGLCDGTGEIDSDSDRICSTCKGTGEDSEGWSCDDCDGDGFFWDSDGWEDEFVRDTADD
ncbi:hypothetical protein [Oscillatoria sp. HE19RPO]|uniref:hypothetical protein n=1 Tax=Oscillatoria sp. HE19RPO TaxID=2954806 RepID=UPI0020C396D1|nr:hypothetical protein [Oscillatoria sp. HE19RPO]